ncbi:hypothetical protein HELRODRAFT_188596 [Helobdella robusta]|uniref:Transmembrane protein 209 n=1 Tax=Helobdella robusta TaxID=6412 RepID=T1FQ57_HELRO|nr:hypothetical protein HELRODRAFT_188596 [Helobdella robusta]ESO02150.1 hypothetical protein HELRODRAFT_188596 [Helobdella robusta]
MILMNERFNSSLVKQVSDIRRLHFQHSTNMFWAVVNLFVAFILHLEMSYGTFIMALDLMFPSFKMWYIGVLVEVLFILNACCNLIKYMKVKTLKPLVVTDVLKKACNISDDEPGFVSMESEPSNNIPVLNGHVMEKLPEYSPSHYSSYLSMSTPRTSHSTSNDLYNCHALNNSLDSRSHDDVIEDVHSLKSFLKEQNENELRCRRVEMALGNSGGTFLHSPRSYNYAQIQQQHSPISQLMPPLSPPLDHYHHQHLNGTSIYPPNIYQLARPAQQTNTSHSTGGTFLNSDSNADDAWSSLDVSNKLDLWTERLRKYLSGTILKKLVDEMASVNSLLAGAGMEDVQVGGVSITALKQLTTTKTHLLPHLSNILPFLEISSNQEYVVQRVKELNSGGGLSCFKWNGGGEMRGGRRWEEILPTDSALLMHCLCCYLDMRLPSHPTFSDGKPFTNQHLIRASNKTGVSEMKDGIYFLEGDVHPPHYDVIYNGSLYKIKRGRLNLFHAILLFFYFIKTKEHGTIGRMSLGMSGINILWIFDN